MTSADMKSAVRKALGDRQYLPVQFTTSEQPTRWRRGMVYLNGLKVVFASYGATMEGVVSWRVEDSEVSTERGIEMTEKIRVQYQSGESREHPNKAVDYMLAEVDGVELYAEAEAVDSDETRSYDELRVEIMRQAVERGIDVASLEFPYDDQPETRLLSTSQAADILSITEIRVRQLCEAGRMGRKVGRDWVITPEEIEANRKRKPAGRPRKEEPYERKGEWGGYKVRKSAKGFIVEHWSAVAGNLTGDKYLVPFATAEVSEDADLNTPYNDHMTNGDAVYTLGDSWGARTFRKGHIVQ